MDLVRLYPQGFGTVILGSFPARTVYVPTLEFVKARATHAAQHDIGLEPATAAALGNGLGGASASLLSQMIFVPVDIISQRLMVQGAAPPAARQVSPQAPSTLACPAQRSDTLFSVCGLLRRRTGLDVLREILRSEGVKGLYRGYGTSVVLYVPQSALWWGSYGIYQSFLWHRLERVFGEPEQEVGAGEYPPGESPAELAGHNTLTTERIPPHLQQRDIGADTGAAAAGTSRGLSVTESLGWTLAVQTGSAVLAGLTTGALTTPLDVVKTRLQVGERDPASGRAPTFRYVTAVLCSRGAVPPAEHSRTRHCSIGRWSPTSTAGKGR